MSCCTYSCKFLSPCLVVLHLLALNDGFPWSGLNKNIVFQTSTVYTNLRNIFPSITSRNNFFCSLQIISKSNNCSDSIQTIPYDKNTSRVYVFKDNSIRKTSNQTKKIDSFGSLDEKVKFITSTLLDYDLLNRTIEEWRKPLSKDYISKPLVLVGPSGVGKGRLVKALLYDYNRFFSKVVTHTTRNPRREEVNGTNYHFIPLERYHELVTQGNYFLEHAQVHNNFYGVSYAALESVTKSGKIPILEIDIQGAKVIRDKATSLGIAPKYLFVAPPSLAMLEDRLIRRGAESAEEIRLRLRNAEIELEEAYRCQLFDHIMVNNVFDQSVNQFFRLARDWYPTIPSAARLRMLMRRAQDLKSVVRAMKEESASTADTR